MLFCEQMSLERRRDPAVASAASAENDGLIARISRMKAEIDQIGQRDRKALQNKLAACNWKRYAGWALALVYVIGVFREHRRLSKIAARIAVAANGSSEILPALIVTERWRWLQSGVSTDSVAALRNPSLPNLPLLLIAMLWPLSTANAPLTDLRHSATLCLQMIDNLFKFAMAARKRAHLMKKRSSDVTAADAVAVGSAFAVS